MKYVVDSILNNLFLFYLIRKLDKINIVLPSVSLSDAKETDFLNTLFLLFSVFGASDFFEANCYKLNY
jgi:hypothetical protein